MRRLFVPALLLVVAHATTFPSRAAQSGVDPEVQSTITAQIEALDRGDAALAESFASPGIKAMFPDASTFYGMVKQSYAPLVHPRSTHFEPTLAAEGGTLQHVTVVDSEGLVWTAVYTMEKVDGHWAISGCTLVKSKETTA